jgi:hypothetical protein
MALVTVMAQEQFVIVSLVFWFGLFKVMCGQRTRIPETAVRAGTVGLEQQKVFYGSHDVCFLA